MGGRGVNLRQKLVRVLVAWSGQAWHFKRLYVLDVSFGKQLCATILPHDPLSVTLVLVNTMNFAINSNWLVGADIIGTHWYGMCDCRLV